MNRCTYTITRSAHRRSFIWLSRCETLASPWRWFKSAYKSLYLHRCAGFTGELIPHRWWAADCWSTTVHNAHCAVEHNGFCIQRSAHQNAFSDWNISELKSFGFSQIKLRVCVCVRSPRTNCNPTLFWDRQININLNFCFCQHIFAYAPLSYINVSRVRPHRLGCYKPKWTICCSKFRIIAKLF